MAALLPPLVEPVPVQEVYIDGIARIDQLGTNLKLVFYSLQRPLLAGPHEYERVIVAKFIMPATAVHSAAIQAMTEAETLVGLDRTH